MCACVFVSEVWSSVNKNKNEQTKNDFVSISLIDFRSLSRCFNRTRINRFRTKCEICLNSVTVGVCVCESVCFILNVIACHQKFRWFVIFHSATTKRRRHCGGCRKQRWSSKRSYEEWNQMQLNKLVSACVWRSVSFLFLRRRRWWPDEKKSRGDEEINGRKVRM